MNSQWHCVQKRSKIFLSLCIAFCLSAALLVSCTGTDDANDLLDDLGDFDDITTLSFSDADFVSGLDFVNGDTTGTTGSLGQFSFDLSESISFSIGDIDLGTIDPSTIGSNNVIDTSFFDASNVGSISSETGNISQFLQSLDDDADITNGISIPSDVHTAASSMDIDFSLSPSEFQSTYQSDVNTLTTNTTAGERDFIDRTTAESNFQDYLDGGGEPPLGAETCTTTTPYGSCAFAKSCAPADVFNEDCYYEADDGTRWYFDCMDSSAAADAAADIAAYCAP